jgi:hypothetical protein
MKWNSELMLRIVSRRYPRRQQALERKLADSWISCLVASLYDLRIIFFSCRAARQTGVSYGRPTGTEDRGVVAHCGRGSAHALPFRDDGRARIRRGVALPVLQSVRGDFERLNQES